MYVEADLNCGFSLTPGEFISLNPKTGVHGLCQKTNRNEKPEAYRRVWETVLWWICAEPDWKDAKAVERS